MKNVVFTICAKNYIGLAQVLEQSLLRFHQDLDFYIFVADEYLPSDELNYENLILAKNVLNFSPEKWNELSFKYDLTEFCTCIKPECFNYLFSQKSYEKIIYLDPDILVCNSLEYIFEQLTLYSIVLTPHLTHIEPSLNGLMQDNAMLNTGIFNLGFIGLRRGEISSSMLTWWNKKLIDYCFIDYSEGYYTDQKWMNFLPAYFNSQDLLISFHLGMNLAPWNFGERKLVIHEDKFYVQSRVHKSQLFPLLFVHFSGFDYKSIISGTIYHTTIKSLKVYEDLLPLFNEYEKLLLESNFIKYRKLNYTYNFFDGQIPISYIHRRLYRRLLQDNINMIYPFNTGHGSFFELLKKNKMISLETLLVDKRNRFNTPNLGRRLRCINTLSKIIYRIIGYNRYFMIIKLLKSYSRVENQVHLIDQTYSQKNVLHE